MKIAALIPVFNEADIIAHTIAHLLDSGIEVFVLDNESTDGTRDIVESLNVPTRTLRTGGLFNEPRLQEELHRYSDEIEADWILKNDADEFIESPYSNLSLADAIVLADLAGKTCIGSRSFVFYPMSDEAPHVPGTDVRSHYDHYRVWDAVDRWPSDIHAKHNELWKVNIYKKAAGVRMIDPHRVDVPDLRQSLFAEFFVLRHYPYRNPELTYRRLVRERRDRLSPENLAQHISDHYIMYSDDSDFVKKGFTFDRMRSRCQRWSQYEKPRH